MMTTTIRSSMSVKPLRALRSIVVSLRFGGGTKVTTNIGGEFDPF
jgi:hypothetical protein